MRKYVGSSILFAGLIFLLSACQTIPLIHELNGTVSPEDSVSIVNDKGSGTWRGQDISLAYSYSRAAAGMELSGKVLFADYLILGFSLLQDFHLLVIFVDTNGKVIQTAGIASNRGDFSPLSFKTRLAVPNGTAAISFGYEGSAEGGGRDGGGIMKFYQFPVH